MSKETFSKNGASNALAAGTRFPHTSSQPLICLSEFLSRRKSHTLPMMSLPQAVHHQDIAAQTPVMVLVDAGWNEPISIKPPPSHPHFDHKRATLLLPHQIMISSQASTLMVAKYQSVGPLSTSTGMTLISPLHMAKLDSEHVGSKAETAA